MVLDLFLWHKESGGEGVGLDLDWVDRQTRNAIPEVDFSVDHDCAVVSLVEQHVAALVR
jgi:hypothetical protein